MPFLPASKTSLPALPCSRLYRADFCGWFALLLLLLTNSTAVSQTTVVVLPGQNNTPISRVQLRINGNLTTQTTEPSPGVHINTDSSVELISVRINDSGVTRDLPLFNLAGATMHNINLTSNTQNLGVINNGSITTTSNMTNFVAAMTNMVSNNNLNNYMFYDFATNMPPPGTADYDIRFVKALTNQDFVLVSERWGNSPFVLRPLDRFGNVITSANTVVVGGPSATSWSNPYEGYDWNTGFASSSYQNGQAFVMTVFKVTRFGLPDNQPVYGFRIDNDGDADLKFFSLSDESFDNNPPYHRLGNLVFRDNNNNGRFDTGEGVGGVNLELLNGSNQVIRTTTSSTVSGQVGYYLFEGFSAGTYRVRIPASEFASGRPLFGAQSIAPASPADDAKDDSDATGDSGVDNANPAANGILSPSIVIAGYGEPTAALGETGFMSNVDDTDDDNGNLTVDFGFSLPTRDFGDFSGFGSVSNLANQNLRLGALVDAEAAAQTNATATGDDLHGSDDEDGVVVPATVVPGQTASITVTRTNTIGATAYLDAWLDFNRNGALTEANEKIINNVSVATGTSNSTVTYNFTVPSTATSGVAGLRVRLARTSGLGPTGDHSSAGEIEDYTVNIAPANCPTITTTRAGGGQNYTPGDTYSFSGGTAPYTYSVSAGSLPSALTLNSSTGQITGTLLEQPQQAFTLRATDANGCFGEITILYIYLCPTLALSPTTLSAPSQGVSYSQTVTASGGTTPYSYAVTSGALPAGLSLNASTGLISGTPSATGASTFIVRATDALGCTVSRSYTVTVGTGGGGGGTLAITKTSNASLALIPGQTITYTVNVHNPSTTTTHTNVTVSDPAPAGTTFVSGSVNASLSGGWLHSRDITINAALVDAALTNFPVRVALNSGNFSFAKARSDGHDIRFRDLSGNDLVFERESHDAASATAVYWVRVPSVSSSASTVFRVFYGNPAAPNAANTSGAVWDSNYLAVYHMHQNPGGSAPQMRDSTANARHGTVVGGVTSVAGQNGQGVQLNGSTGFIRVPTAGNLNITGNQYTLEAWVYPHNVSSNDQGIISMAQESSANEERYHLGWNWNGGLNVRRFSGSLSRLDGTSGTVVNNQWQYLAGRYTGSALQAWKNAAQVNSISASGNITSTSNDLLLGRRYDNRFFNGRFDELRISNAPRSDAWLKASYHSGLGDLFSVGAEAATGGSTGSAPSVASGWTLAPGASLTLSFRFTVNSGFSGTSITNTASVTSTQQSTPSTATITNVVCPAVTVNPTSLANGTLGLAYSQTVTATGGTGPYTWALRSGSLPAGLALNSGTGVISGTPSTGGTFTFTAEATNASGCKGSRAYTLRICPNITPSPSDLSSGSVGVPYSRTISAFSGTAPYTYQVVSGSLPGGFSLDSATGVLSGTAAASGTFTFTIRAADASGCIGTRAYTLVINSPTYDFGDFSRFGSASSIVSSDLTMGDFIDAEISAATNLAATGDDITNINDEDGVTLQSILVQGQAGVTVTVKLKNTSPGPAYLNGWVDFNNNGVLTENERIISNVLVENGVTEDYQNFFFDVPDNATLGVVGARFRLTSTSSPGSTGVSGFGEVEDYTTTIVAPSANFRDYFYAIRAVGTRYYLDEISVYNPNSATPTVSVVPGILDLNVASPGFNTSASNAAMNGLALDWLNRRFYWNATSSGSSGYNSTLYTAAYDNVSKTWSYQAVTGSPLSNIPFNTGTPTSASAGAGAFPRAAFYGGEYYAGGQHSNNVAIWRLNASGLGLKTPPISDYRDFFRLPLTFNGGDFVIRPQDGLLVTSTVIGSANNVITHFLTNGFNPSGPAASAVDINAQIPFGTHSSVQIAGVGG